MSVPGAGPPPAGATPVVELTGASVGYDDQPVVRDVDLRVLPGEVVVLLGPNGSGKTTVVRGILGLARLHAGSVRLFGTPAAAFRARGRIGYVPQRHTVGGGVPSTVREVVSSGRLSHLGLTGRLRAADRAAVERALDTVDLVQQARHPVGELSGGQQRRVLIARALASEPDLLVMDEPTAGVDLSHQAALAETLDRLTRRQVTLLLVAHEVGPVAPLVTRAVVMQEGRVRYDGPPGPVLGGPGHDALHPLVHGDPGHHHVDVRADDVLVGHPRVVR